MFKSIGFVIALFAITKIMSVSFNAFESALVATFSTWENALQVANKQLETIKDD